MSQLESVRFLWAEQMRLTSPRCHQSANQFLDISRKNNTTLHNVPTAEEEKRNKDTVEVEGCNRGEEARPAYHMVGSEGGVLARPEG
eukprot:274354-Ditylum_brightwellii.AAC.1